jgi:hypothetical protein
VKKEEVMKKKFSPIIFFVASLVILSYFGVAGAPAPPSLPSTAGVVRNDYTDTTRSKKVYYTVEQTDGTQTEVWTEEKNIDRLIRRAAANSRQLTVWTEEDGSVAAVETNYEDD